VQKATQNIAGGKPIPQKYSKLSLKLASVPVSSYSSMAFSRKLKQQGNIF